MGEGLPKEYGVLLEKREKEETHTGQATNSIHTKNVLWDTNESDVQPASQELSL